MPRTPLQFRYSGSDNFGLGPRRQVRLELPGRSDVTRPFLPTPEQISEAKEAYKQNEPNENVGFVSGVLTAFDRLLFGQSAKALIAGDVQQALLNNPLFQITDALDITDLTKTYDARRIREAWGDNSEQTGLGNFLINFAVDIALDPTTYFAPFMKLAQIGKAAGGAGGALNVSEGLLTQAIKNGERALFTWKVPFVNIGTTGFFGMELPKSLDLAVARNLEKWANWLNTNKVAKVGARIFGPTAAGIGDVLDETGQVAVAGSVMRDFVRTTLKQAPERGTAYMEQYLPVIRQMVHGPTGRLLIGDKTFQAAVFHLSELGVGLSDHIGTIYNAIDSGVVYARAKDARRLILDTSEEAKDLAARISIGDADAITEWLKAFPNASLPDAGIPLAQQMGVARLDKDLGFDIRGLNDKQQALAVEIASAAGPSSKVQQLERMRLAAGTKSPELQAIEGSKAALKDLLDGLPAKGIELEDITSLAERGRTLMERVGLSDVQSGILNSMTELYIHRMVNPQVLDLVNKQWLSKVKEFGGDAGLALAQSFQQGRKFTDLSTFEVNYFAREFGTRFTGNQPLKNLMATQGQDKAMGWLAKVFDMPFIRQIRGLPGGDEVAEFFSSNPLLSWYHRIKSGGAVTEVAYRNSVLLGEDSPLVLAEDAIGSLNPTLIQDRASKSLRGFLIDETHTAEKISSVSVGRLTAGAVVDDIHAAKALAKHDLREFVTEAIRTRKFDDKQVIDMLSKDLVDQKMSLDQLNKVQTFSPAGAAHVKMLKDIRTSQQAVDGLKIDLGDLEKGRLDATTLRANAQAELGNAKKAAEALRVRERGLRAVAKKDASYTAYADEAAKAAKHHENLVKSFEADLSSAKGIANLAERAKKALRTDIAFRQDEIKKLAERSKGFRSAIHDEIDAIYSVRNGFIDRTKKLAKDKKQDISKLLADGLEKGKFSEELALQHIFRENGVVALDELQERLPNVFAELQKKHAGLKVRWVDSNVADGLWGPKGLFARMRHPDEPGAILKTLDALTWQWKAWTTLNPFFINTRIRDVLSTTMMFAIHGQTGAARELIPGVGDAWSITNAVQKHLRGEATAVASKILTRSDGQIVQAQDLLNAMQSRGAMNSGLVNDEIIRLGEEWSFRAGGKGGEFAKSFITPNARNNQIIEYGYRTAEYGDNLAKVAGVLAEWKSGKTLDEAIDFVKAYAYNPTSANLLTSTERFGIRRPIPFYAYTKFAVQTIGKQALLRPGVLAWWDKAINNASHAAGLTPEEIDLIIPEFIRDNLGIPTGRDAEGNPTYYTFGSFLPQADVIKLATALSETFGGKPESTGQIIGEKLNPLLRLPIEKVMGRSFYRQAPLQKFEGEAVEFLGVPMSKGAAELWRSIRFLNEIDRLGIFMSDDAKSMLRAPNNVAMQWLSGAFGVLPARRYAVREAEQIQYAKASADAEWAKQKGQLRKQIEVGSGRATRRNITTLQELLAKSAAKQELVHEIESRAEERQGTR